ncbi:Cna B-type domain-containing protein [Bacillus sp. SIMBA_074]|uniref:Cna B-type domain-containing protein n=1 Tax=Bacillus sp. SIMBA_074 TaxID=3085812 RepID=UPI00397B241D
MKKRISVIATITLLLNIFCNGLLSIAYAEGESTTQIEVVQKELLKARGTSGAVDPEVKAKIKGIETLPSRLIHLQTTSGEDLYCLDEGLVYPDNNTGIEIKEHLKDPRVAWLLQNYYSNKEIIGGENPKIQYAMTQIVLWGFTNSNKQEVIDIINQNEELKNLYDLAQTHANDVLPQDKINSYTITLSPDTTELTEKGDSYESVFDVKVTDTEGRIVDEIELNEAKYNIETNPTGFEKYVKVEQSGTKFRIFIDKKDIENIPLNLEIKLSLSTLFTTEIMGSVAYTTSKPGVQPLGVYKAAKITSQKQLDASAKANFSKVITTTVEGTKKWKDDNEQDRPTAIKVDLLQNEKVILTQDVNAANGWKYTFADLPQNDAEGNAYKYEVKEQPVDGYKSEVKGYDITNTKVAQTKVEGTKTWKDGDSKERPTAIKVDLLQNEKVILTQDVNAANGWKYTFADLPQNDAEGNAYKYEVKEQPVDGYKSEVKGYDITNTKVAQTKVEGTKKWKDGDSKERPKTIKVDLLQNKKVIATQDVNAASDWKYEFKDLAAYDAEGNAYKYEVKEQPVDGYKSEVKGYDITNTKVAQTTVEGTKKWKDGDSKERPKAIKVDLLQNKQVIATQEVTKASDWKYAFKDLAAYDAEGNAYKYEVKEQAVDGYKSEVKGYDITNTKVGQTKVEGTKMWKDGDSKERPKTIKVDLLQNKQVIATQEVTKASDWKYAFKDLAAYDAEGNAYKYEVKEQAVDGYKSEVKGYDITNTKVGQTKVEGTKMWKDGDSKERPKTIKVDLIQNKQVIATQEVTKASDWKYAFKDLAAYDAEGNAYKYEVKEQAVDGYKSEVKGYDITNTKVGQTKVEGTKTWKDGDSKERPKTIKVDLLQNKQVIATQEVTKASDWKYAFKDLAAYDAEGNAYKYEVKEQPVDGYKSEVNSYDIKNTKVGQTKVEGTKTWKDDNEKDRPEMIKVELLQNGQVIATQEVTKASGWKYEFKDLAAYDAEGNAYKYEVKEQPVDGYKSEVKGYDITNTKIKDVDPVDQTKVEGTKTWKDDNEKDRPEMIKVELLQNGQVIATQEVTKASGWKYEFKDLAVYDAEGKAYKYEVKEQPVDRYKSEVNGYNITNTKIKDVNPVDPKDPANPVDPKDPANPVDPKDPANPVDPKDPVNPKDDTKVPSTKDNQEKSSWLPNTGGTATEMIPIAGGMILLVLGGILFSRRKVK